MDLNARPREVGRDREQAHYCKLEIQAAKSGHSVSNVPREFVAQLIDWTFGQRSGPAEGAAQR
jgi:hypothetical protein